MTMQDDLRASRDVVVAFAAALENELGRDTLLTVGRARDSIVEIVGDPEARAMVLDFDLTTGAIGIIAFISEPSFVRTVEGTSADEEFVTAMAAPLTAAASALGTLTRLEIEADADDLRELTVAALTGELEADIVAYPILEGVEPVACLVIGVGVAAAPEGKPASTASTAAVPANAPALATPTGGALVLADVEMGVTAELGRSQMTVRELLSITPGAVIDLDRSVGTPVDLLVNGTAIARGEVVIVDEEFGIRITEILSSRSSAV